MLLREWRLGRRDSRHHVEKQRAHPPESSTPWVDSRARAPKSRKVTKHHHEGDLVTLLPQLVSHLHSQKPPAAVSADQVWPKCLHAAYRVDMPSTDSFH